MTITVNYYDDNRKFYFCICSIKDTIYSFLKKTGKNSDVDDDKGNRSLEVFLNGQSLPKDSTLEQYLNELHYYALFISNDPTKELIIKPLPINLEDYQIDKPINGFIRSATDKKTGKKVLINYSNNTPFPHNNCVSCVYINQLLNLLTVPKILGYYFSSSNELINFYIEELDEETTDFCPKDIKNYLNSEGSDQTKMNPTIRSKIIFGVASIMKKIHEKRIIYGRLNSDSIKLDKNMEPILSNFNYARFHINKQDDYITEPIFNTFYRAPDKRFSIPYDVYSYAIFLYVMFNSKNTFYFDDGSKLQNQNQLLRQIQNGVRYERPKNVPDHY